MVVEVHFPRRLRAVTDRLPCRRQWQPRRVGDPVGGHKVQYPIIRATISLVWVRPRTCTKEATREPQEALPINRRTAI